MKFPFYQQLDRMDCGPCCLQMLLKYYSGKKYNITYLRNICDIGKDGTSLLALKEAASSFGLMGQGYKINISELNAYKAFPAILYWDENHFVILYQIKKSFWGAKEYFIADPFRGKYVLNENDFKRLWLKNNQNSGYLLFFDHIEPNNIHDENIEKSTSNFLLENVKKHKYSYATILAGIVLSMALQVIFPFLSKSLFDFGIDEKNFSFVIFIILSQAFFYFTKVIIQYLRDFTALKTGTMISISLVTRYLEKIVGLRYEYFDMKNSGDVIQGITDNSRIENLLTNNLVSFILSITNLVVFEFILLYFDWRLFAILNIAILIYFLWSSFILNKFKSIDYLRFEIMSKNQGFVYQLINGILDLKMNNGITRKKDEWVKLRQGLYEVSKKSIALHQIKSVLGLLIMNFTTLIIIGYTSFQVIKGMMSVGEFIAIQYIIAQLTSPIDDILEFKLSYSLAKMSADRFNDVNDFPSEKYLNHNLKIDFGNDIVVNDLSFSYPGSKKKPILYDINTVIKTGKITAIVGPSGSGKTTFAKLLLKLYEPTSGTIKINNKSLIDISHEAWRTITGSVLQEGYIFSESLLNNIVIEGGEIDRKRLEYSVSIANLEELIQNLPNGYNSIIGLDGLGLSGGQKQRILIARCVYKNPELLIFDEATNALDSINEDLIYNNLSKYYNGKTVLLIAHRLSTIRHADQILVFNNGTIEESGTHEELMQEEGLYYKLCLKQQLSI
ncbi:peptidase domain-containing ABC transporter [Sphingobacterium faecium]|uniref:peptidase domain-containing ABC transporter n=1 Tax=Sphingobacterium faecium TaxID=34087 RepID=UPI00320A382C